MAGIDDIQREIAQTQTFVQERFDPIKRELSLVREEQERLAGEVSSLLDLQRSERREALRYAFERADDGDTVLLAGKGTEQSIVVGTEHLPWDEARVARELLKELA